MGCAVKVICLSHNINENDSREYQDVLWSSVSLLPSPISALIELKKQTLKFSPDWIVGFSDIYYGILATRFARAIGSRSLVDAYDNYQSYIPWALPLHVMWRSALSNADLISATGHPLLKLLSRDRSCDEDCVVPMAADDSFHKFDSAKAAEIKDKYQLPGGRPLIGYCGAIAKNRDVSLLLELIKETGKHRPDVLFILTGRISQHITLPDNCRHLGFVDADDMPGIIFNLHIMLALNKDSQFGRHSYPVKLYEAASLGVKTIASRTPATEWMYGNNSPALADIGDCSQLTDKICAALEKNARGFTLSAQRWQQSADILAEAMGLSLLR